jgi:hypothetical protein
MVLGPPIPGSLRNPSLSLAKTELSQNVQRVVDLISISGVAFVGRKISGAKN